MAESARERWGLVCDFTDANVAGKIRRMRVRLLPLPRLAAAQTSIF
jgi:hypothetical protein